MATLQVAGGIQASREGREILEAVRRDHARVLDANSAQSHQIETGLHRYGVAFEQDVLVGPAQGRFLVNVEPDAVAGGVVHLRAPIGTLEALRRRPVPPIHHTTPNPLPHTPPRSPA